jgi:Flp pilus assembly secretin CpaC
LIEQGVEIPYQQATSSGATSISFRKANLALKVKPQITPDGRVNLTVDVNKDSPNTLIATGAGVAIDTKHVKTEVLVENGGTVVIGGIYTQDEKNLTSRIPVLGIFRTLVSCSKLRRKRTTRPNCWSSSLRKSSARNCRCAELRKPFGWAGDAGPFFCAAAVLNC